MRQIIRHAASTAMSAASTLSNQYAFLVILAVAFILRIYRLDTPDMWGDELFGPVMASKPLEYLLRWNLLEDVHPPTFYFFLKPVLLASRSDFALRFPAMALGVLSIFLLYRLGKTWLGEQGGLLAAGLLAVSVPHIYLSRVVRFYSFTVVLCLLAMILVTRFTERRDNRTLAWFAAVLGALLLAEFTSVIPILALCLTMLAAILFGPDRMRHVKALMKYGLLAAAVPGCFLLATSLQRKGFAWVSTPLGALYNFLNALTCLTGLEAGASGGAHWLTGVAAAIVLIGAARLLIKNRPLLGMCLSFVLSAIAVTLLLRPGYALAFWHLFYLIPVLALLGASAVQAILPVRFQNLAAIGIPIVGAILLLGPYSSKFYTPTAYDSDIKERGRAMASLVAPGSVTLLDPMSIDFTTWYTNQFSLENRLSEQHVTADPSPLTMNIFVEQGGLLGHLVSARQPVSSWADVVRERFLGIGSLVTAVVPRTPQRPLDFSGASQEFDAHPGHFYRDVHTADQVLIDPYWGNRVIAAENGKPAAFEYRFVNPDGSGDKNIDLTIHYLNRGKDSVFKAWTRFDDEAPVECIASTGPEAPNQDLKGDSPSVERVLSMRRDRPFNTLTVGFTFTCALVTPHYPTSNLVTTGFKRLFLSARSYGPDLMDKSAMDPDFELTGFGGVEHDGDRVWRWATGPHSDISFTARQEASMRLTYAMVNPMKDQGYALTVNGKQVGGDKGLPAQTWMEPHPVKVVEFTAKPGRNTVSFQFEKINHVNDSFSETDATPYTTAFKILRLEPVAGSPAEAK